MGMVVRWQYRVNGSQAVSNWKPKSVLVALDRVRRYWDVEFRQVTGAVSLVVEARRMGAGTVAMVQEGANRIWVNADFRWGVSDAAYQQMAMTFCHELGHFFSGNRGHNPALSVMSAWVGDPYQNWVQTDMAWFGRLPWRSSVRPWDAAEVAAWRPRVAAGPFVELGFAGCGCGPGVIAGASDSAGVWQDPWEVPLDAGSSVEFLD